MTIMEAFLRGFALVTALFVAAAGVALCLTVIGILPGVGLLLLASILMGYALYGKKALTKKETV